MAVDYFHRLLVSGRRDRVRDFRRRMHREYPRRVAGTTWTEIVPFSFAALYEIAPRARRVQPEVPWDPYELTVWPVTRVGKRDGMLRYQLQTRSLEMAPFVRVLARAVRDVTFTLVTFCLDDSSIESYRCEAGRHRTWSLPPGERKRIWERARRKFGLSGDDVYEDDEAERWAEEEMLKDALSHWELDAQSSSRVRRYDWWNRRPLRTLDEERALVAIQLDVENTADRRKRIRTRKAGTPGGKRTRAAEKKR